MIIFLPRTCTLSPFVPGCEVELKEVRQGERERQTRGREDEIKKDMMMMMMMAGGTEEKEQQQREKEGLGGWGYKRLKQLCLYSCILLRRAE